MKCEICGRSYIALGVHLRHKHQVDPDAYREEYGILRTTPLVDDDLSEQISKSAKRRLLDPEYKAEVQARCHANAEKNKGKPSAGMTRAGKAALAQRNADTNIAYLKRQAPLVAKVLREKKTLTDVRRDLGVGAVAAKKIVLMGLAEYDKDTAIAAIPQRISEEAKAERNRRAAATTRAKAMARVSKVIPFFDTTKSAAEMCRLAGISIKTYKNWLKAGLIPRHPNGRGPLPKVGA